MTATSVAVPPVETVAAVPLAPAPRLRDVLADPGTTADKASAFRALYARWGIEARPGAGTPGCADARAHGLQCLARSGTWWSKLRRLDVPAILELRSAGGEARYASVVAATDDAVTLAFGSRELTFPPAEVDAAWEGAFVALWKRPPVDAAVVAPGARGRDVRWLRQRLDEVDGTPPLAPVATPDLYDAELQRRVSAFQRRRALAPDAIVGEETLAHLSLGGDGQPSLTRKP
jgi:general secretion pathway protein A